MREPNTHFPMVTPEGRMTLETYDLLRGYYDQISMRYGQFFYQVADTTHSLSVAANVRTPMPITINETIAGNAPTKFASWEPFQGGRFRPIGLSVADLYEFTFEIDVTPQIDGEVLRFDIDIGSTSSIPIKPKTVSLAAQAGDTEKVSFPFDVYTGALFNQNGGLIHVTGNGGVTLGRIDVKVDVVRVG